MMNSITKALKKIGTLALVLTMIIPGTASAGVVANQGSLTLSFSRTSPIRPISAGQTNVHISTFTLTAAVEDIVVSNLSFTKIGSVRNALIQNIQLRDSRGVILAPVVGALDPNSTANFGVGAFTIRAGTTESFLLYADIAQQAVGSFGFRVNNSDSIQAIGLASAQVIRAASYKWPLTTTARQVGTFAPELTVASSIVAGPGFANPGETRTLANFDLIGSNTEDVAVRSITITSNSAAQNLSGNYRILLNNPNGGVVIFSGIVAGNTLGGNLVIPFIIRQGERVGIRLEATIAPNAARDTVLTFSMANNQSVQAVGVMSGIIARIRGMFPVPSSAVTVL